MNRGNNWKELIEHTKTCVDQSLKSASEVVFGASPEILRDAVNYSLFAPGKRLRPLLVCFTAQACGATIEAALPAAIAVEMVHTYSLIHDDLPAMDNDDLRRGLPTCHVKYGEAAAILAGDALLTAAFEWLSHCYPPRLAAVNVLLLSRGAGASGMVGGQMLDLIAEGRYENYPRPGSVAELELIHRLKTGALFSVCCQMGLEVAKEFAQPVPPAKYDDLVKNFSQSFGLAFQIADDLLDVEAHVDVVGKKTGKDADRGKLTFPTVLGIDASRERAYTLYQQSLELINQMGVGSQPLAALVRMIMERDR
ncbi:MAG: polyprenyl synthetase family protein [Zavarzinella sp.]